MNHCPNCGYCPTCGRSNYTNPYPFQPTITWGGVTGQTGTITGPYLGKIQPSTMTDDDWQRLKNYTETVASNRDNTHLDPDIK